MSKQGSTLAGVMDAFSVAISIGLQYGVPLETYVSKFTNMRFEPAGMTDDTDVRMAASVMDYIFRRLALDFLPYDTRADLGIFTAKERAAQVQAEAAAEVAAANADVLEDMKAKFTEMRDNINLLCAKVAEKADIAVEEIKSHINPQTLAEIQSFLEVCKDEKEIEKGKTPDVMQQACTFIKDHWYQVQAKFHFVKGVAGAKFDEFKKEIAFDFIVLKEVAKDKWKVVKQELAKFKDLAKTTLEKLAASFEHGWSELTTAIHNKLSQWDQKAKDGFAKLKEAAKEKWEHVKVDAGLLADAANAKYVAGKAKFDEAKDAIKSELADKLHGLANEIGGAEKEIDNVLKMQ